MSCLSWNCRGLGNPRAVLALKELVRSHKSDIVFLIEILVHSQCIAELRVLLVFEGCFNVDSSGNSGGLAVFWWKAPCVMILHFSSNFIDMSVCLNGVITWRLIGFYGYPAATRHRESWSLLRQLAGLNSLPWVCIGDFNNLLLEDDKRGGLPPNASLLQGSIEVCNLIDMPLQGYYFTWSHGRVEARIEEWLDRSFTIESWLHVFPNSSLHNLVISYSDHSPILLVMEKVVQRRRPRRFRFENAWTQEPNFFDVIKGSWNPSLSDEILSKIEDCGRYLFEWGKSLRNHFRHDIARLRKQMQQQRALGTDDASCQYEALKQELNSLLAQEEVFWKQRSKLFWLRQGDLNTKYFHAAVSQWARSNFITRLRNSVGA